MRYPVTIPGVGPGTFRGLAEESQDFTAVVLGLFVLYLVYQRHA